MVTLTLLSTATSSVVLPPNPLVGFDWAGFAIQVYAAVGALLSLLIGWGFKLLRAYLVAKTGNENLATLTSLADTVVAEIEMTLRKEAQEAAADGVITPEEQAKLKQAAKDKLLSYVSVKGIGAVKGAFKQDMTAMDNLVGGLIEQAVHGLKSKPAS